MKRKAARRSKSGGSRLIRTESHLLARSDNLGAFTLSVSSSPDRQDGPERTIARAVKLSQDTKHLSGNELDVWTHREPDTADWRFYKQAPDGSRRT